MKTVLSGQTKQQPGEKSIPIPDGDEEKKQTQLF